jgi:hypothetical protein
MCGDTGQIFSLAIGLINLSDSTNTKQHSNQKAKRIIITIMLGQNNIYPPVFYNINSTYIALLTMLLLSKLQNHTSQHIRSYV